jgi:hypothetical protein
MKLNAKESVNYSNTMNMTNCYAIEHLCWETKGLNSIGKLDLIYTREIKARVAQWVR